MPKYSRPDTIFQRLISKISNKLTLCIIKIKRAINISIEYKYTNFSIALPADHLLPSYQEHHKLYDRFLPHLSQYLEPKSAVIDVGANCGDTLAAMYEANRNLTYICIEPDDTFFYFLQNNVLRIKAIDANASVQTIKALVGKHISDVSLEGSGGTKKSSTPGIKGKTISSQSLDDILSICKTANIRLLKSDVDGFDYDVLDSADSVLITYSPMIFFECQFDHAFQKAGYEKTIEALQSKGYTNWALFDNFGGVVFRTNDIQHITQLFDYVWRQNLERSTKTIYYYDIFAANNRDKVLMDKVIEDYLATNHQ